MHSPLLQVDQASLHRRVAQVPILDQVSFQVRVGERWGLVGASGAGKTSLLRLLNRLEDPSQGTLYWRGSPMLQMPVLQLRQRVVLVLQESRLLGMTVEEAMAYPLRLRSLPLTEIQHRVTHWVDRLQIPQDWLGRTEMELSVGQRQWVAIARALATQPEVLLLDEPTSALDMGRTTQLVTLLKDLAAEQHLTSIMVNHQLEVIQQFSSHVLHLHEGRVVTTSPATDVDWPALSQMIQHTEAQAQQEWE